MGTSLKSLLSQFGFWQWIANGGKTGIRGRHATARGAHEASFSSLFGLSRKKKKIISRHGMEMDLNGRQSAREKGKPKYYKCLFHQFVHGPADVQTPQITIVLTNAQEHHRDTGGVHHADKRADHVAHRVALGDDEAVHADAVVAELALRS